MIKIKNLIVKAINGDKEAFDELALSMKNYLYHEAKTKLYNSQDVEDAVQSTLYVAYKEFHTLRTPYGFKSWITTILYNQCYKICKDDIKHKKVIQKMSKYARVAEPEFDIDEFDNLIQGLSDKEKNIIELLCRKDLTYKQVAKKLNMNESTVKYYAKTRFSMLKELLNKRTVIIFILCFLIVGVVSAITFISYLKRAVSTEDVGVNNDGVLMAIENLDWYQQVDMDYKDLGDGYRIKMEHLSMDEMCLYMIFDLESDKDISKYTDVSLPDLKVLNENNDVI
ncbi:MAG: sigma-70 family RNA polymerase sigma factor, partial [Clostridia bacterium]|nr:sigma-70 family RNA polymerase sigma factor [Clostridia bacterium]